ncbi:MAG TPA: hypothetical protein VMD75_06065, partial [Candidatus Binataceae bacterium]|nr:hypothetical protein [Candidatus Binataceae bacterium]
FFPAFFFIALFSFGLDLLTVRLAFFLTGIDTSFLQRFCWTSTKTNGWPTFSPPRGREYIKTLLDNQDDRAIFIKIF